MPIIATRLATDMHAREGSSPVLVRVLKALLPAANPDIESRFVEIRLWWVEIDEFGVPQRELGFDSGGGAIVAAPDERNMGFWTDSSMTFDALECETVEQGSFDAAWRAATTPGTP